MNGSKLKNKYNSPTCSISWFHLIFRMHLRRWRHNRYGHRQLHTLIMHTVKIINILPGRAHNASVNASRASATDIATDASTTRTDARTWTATGATRSRPWTDHAHGLRRCTGRCCHVMMGVRMRMWYIIIARVA